MSYMVSRISPRAGLIEPLRHAFSAHSCTRGQEIGIKERYDTREKADADASRLEQHVRGLEPESADAYVYRGTLIAE